MGRCQRGKGRQICNKKYSYVNLSWPGLPVVYLPCPHQHFKTPTVDRKTIDRDQHINLLSTPKGYRWDNPQDKQKQLCPGKQSGKKKMLCIESSDKQQCKSNAMDDVWKCMTPDLLEKLCNIFVDDFQLSKNETNKFMNEQKDSSKVAQKMSMCKCPCAGDSEYVWMKEFTDLIGCKLRNCIGLTLCSWRTRRQKMLMELVINCMREISGECVNIACPETRMHKLMVFFADRMGVWLDRMLEDADKKILEESQGKEADDSEKRKREEEERARKEEEERARKEEEERKAKEEAAAGDQAAADAEAAAAAAAEKEAAEKEAAEKEAAEREAAEKEAAAKEAAEKEAAEKEAAEKEAADKEAAAAAAAAEKEAAEKEKAAAEKEAAEKEAAEKEKQAAADKEAADKAAADKEAAEKPVAEEAKAEEAVAEEAKAEEAVAEEAVAEEAVAEEAVAEEAVPEEGLPEEGLPEEAVAEEAVAEEGFEEVAEEAEVKPSIQPVEEAPPAEGGDLAMQVIVDWINETEYSPSDRQKQISKVLTGRLAQTLQEYAGIDGMGTAIDNLGRKCSTWIDKLAEQAEAEIKPLIRSAASKMFPASKGVLYHIKRGSDNYYKVRQVSCTDVSGRKSRIDSPMTSDDVKDFTKWAEGLIHISDAWTRWVENAFCEAYTMYNRNADKPSELTANEFNNWRDKKRMEAIQWKRAQKCIFNKAKKWEEWAIFTKNELAGELCQGDSEYQEDI